MTSEANVASCQVVEGQSSFSRLGALFLTRSTIELMVLTRRRTSPLASIVTFWLRSPLATAVVALAMERTWSVRFPAIWLTESTSDFHSPETLTL